MTQLRVFVALAGMMACGAAQSADSATSLQAASQEAAALAVPPPTFASNSLVPLSGTVTAQPESVTFSGNARIASRLAKDPDFGAPHLVLTVDLTGVAGTGSSTHATYVISGPELVQRRLVASQRVEITFPFAKSSGAGTPQSGVASFLLDVDTTTGAVKSASGSIASPNFPR
jgi:hypothetical protein